jgi:hypothetical protein
MGGAVLTLYRNRLEYVSGWRQPPSIVPLRGLEMIEVPPFRVVFSSEPGGCLRVTAGGTTCRWALGSERAPAAETGSAPVSAGSSPSAERNRTTPG